MQLGAFSISLSVENIHASKAFYETLGFATIGGDIDQNWLILRNGSATIGLFHGMFEGNMLTFNPGWSPDAQPLDAFDDVRAIQAHLQTAGISLDMQADPNSTGPAHLALKDPDGNGIFIDQHVDKPD